MTQGEFEAAQASGSIENSGDGTPDTESPTASTNDSVSQFIPLLTQLQSVQQCLAAAPAFIPQTFQDQIQFVYTGGDYYLYLYFNGQWNSFSVTGGSGVTEILAGAGISITPSGGTGNVTITSTIDDATLPMSDITTNNVSTLQHGFVPKLPNDATKFLDGTGAFSTPPSSGGMASATGTDTASGTTPISITHTITHGLGTTPKIISLQVPQLFTPVPGGTGTSYDAQNGWLYLNGSGSPVGGIVTTFHVIAGGGGSTTFSSASTGSSSVSSSGSTSGGTGSASITVNNITSTTFDIVYTGTQSSGSSSFSFPTVSWLAMA